MGHRLAKTVQEVASFSDFRSVEWVGTLFELVLE